MKTPEVFVMPGGAVGWNVWVEGAKKPVRAGYKTLATARRAAVAHAAKIDGTYVDSDAVKSHLQMYGLRG